MNDQAFSTLVERLEKYAHEKPRAYRVRVAALASVGYLYLFAVVLLLLFVVFALFGFGRPNWLLIKIAWIPLGLAWLVLKSLFVKIPEPDGRHLSAKDAPALFELVRHAEVSFQVPRIHHILLDDRFNAGVMQVPSLGMFGWHKNYLVVGLPLMNALTTDQFRAVVAHELGHISNHHGRFSGWIYRVRQTWVQLLTAIQSEKAYASFLFAPFLNWYAPFFGAYSFVLVRAQEYEADACAVELAGKQNAASALVNMEIKTRFLDEDFWPRFFRNADNEREPPPDVLSQMVEATRSPVASEGAINWFASALKETTGHEDTHPSLADRLTAIGYTPDSLQCPEVRAALLNASSGSDDSNAAQYFVGSVGDKYAQSRERWWHELVLKTWRDRHRTIQEARKSIEELEQRSLTESLSPDELWNLALCVLQTEGAEAGTTRLRDVLAADSNHVSANLTLGQILLQNGDETGVAHLELAMSMDRDSVPVGCEVMIAYLEDRGRHGEAERYRVLLEQHTGATPDGQPA